jgi:hypothetical protein
VVREEEFVMGLFYRILGLMAFVHEICASIRVSHIIRVDWIVVAILLFYLFAGASALGLPWPTFPLEIELAYPVVQTTLAFSALALFLICWIKGDTIFRPMNIIARGDRMPQSAVSERAKPIDLRLSGRFDPGFGQRLSLRELPVRWKIEDTGAILLETYIEEVHIGPEFPFPRPDNSGHWSLVIPREVLIEGAEAGILYFGLSACPAFRLRLPARQLTAILSVRNVSQLISLSRMFDEIVTESTAKEADFFQTKLRASLNEPGSSQLPEQVERKVKPGEGVPWTDLIDFAQ